MTKTTKRILAIALSGALLVPAISSAAEAGPRHGWNDHRGGGHGGRGGPDRHRPQHDHGKKHKGNNNAGAAVAAGIIGLAAGAILMGAANQPAYAAPAPDYYPPAPYPGRVATGYGYQPWSPAWYDYCRSKYRSFNPSTGTYTTYGGEQRFCQ